jgi:hypothetical protein
MPSKHWKNCSFFVMPEYDISAPAKLKRQVDTVMGVSDPKILLIGQGHDEQAGSEPRSVQYGSVTCPGTSNYD